MTPVNELADDETRIQVGLSVRQLSLPAQHSSLALYRQLEQRFDSFQPFPPNPSLAARCRGDLGRSRGVPALADALLEAQRT